MNIFTMIKSWFSRKPTVNTFTQLQQIYTGLRGLKLSVINRVNYPVLYKDMGDYKFTLDGMQYSVHMKELFDYGIKEPARLDKAAICVPYDEIPVEPVCPNAPAQQYNISIRNYNVNVDLMAGIDGSIKLNSNVQPSTVKAILSALQDTIIDALQVCDKYTNTKRVPIIVDEKGHRITDEQAVSAGKELEQLYIS